MDDLGANIPNPRCGIHECSRQAIYGIYCRIHRRELIASGELLPRGAQGCTEPDCKNPHKGRGLCQSHINQDNYQKFRRSASTKDIPKAREILEETGWEVSESGCWLWAGAIDAGGYGRVSRTPIAQAAHRVSYAIHFGLIPHGIHIHHICAVRACVNPMHLQAITPQENNAEMLERREYKREIAALKKEVAQLKRELKRVAA